MSDAENEAPTAVTQGGRVETRGQHATTPPVARKKRGPMTRTSVFIEDLQLKEIRSYVDAHGSKESEVIRAALALGMQAIKRPYTTQGMKEQRIDDEIIRVEDAVVDGEFELARKIVRRLQLDSAPLTIRDRLSNSLVHHDYLTALHIIDRLAAREEVE